jgi:YihY family inner membrane protein
MRAHTGLSIARHPLAFVREVVREFRRNQGLLLAGAVAYNTLLSIVPLLILLVFALQFVVSREELLSTLDRYIELVAPATGDAVVSTLAAFLADGAAMSGILLASLLLFSSLAFGALESAMAVIFHHRVRASARHWLVSAVIPYGFVLVLGVGLLIVTIVSGALRTLAAHEVLLFGAAHGLGTVSSGILYAIGVAGEILLLTAIYLVMPVGRLSWRHALIGGVVAGLLWEAMRHALVWYFGTLSQVSLVYGAFATTIAILLSLEIAAVVLLLGAQVIAVYERRLAVARAAAARTHAR